MSVEGNLARKPVAPKDQAPQPAAAQPPAQEGFTPEEEAFFKVGENKTKFAEAEYARQAEIRAYNAGLEKLKAAGQIPKQPQE